MERRNLENGINIFGQQPFLEHRRPISQTLRRTENSDMKQSFDWV